ncbi:hypothetical protein BHE74_00045673 [Ensete ventricosum]|nr:hypothetical protein GW17_00053017 [Ensete ventricosum]RWW48273.1 hypothetical protein BHE74_00045673 [Ensete ventricosum]RZS19939.1 hypothetical protein BHM03_00052402 [Ensete ventricosum]
MFKLLPDSEVRRQASQPDSGFTDPQRWTTAASTCPGSFRKSGEVDPRLCPHGPCRSKRGPLPLNPSLGPPPDQTLKPRPSSSGLLHRDGRPQPQGLLKKPPADPCLGAKMEGKTRCCGQKPSIKAHPTRKKATWAGELTVIKMVETPASSHKEKRDVMKKIFQLGLASKDDTRPTSLVMTKVSVESHTCHLEGVRKAFTVGQGIKARHGKHVRKPR